MARQFQASTRIKSKSIHMPFRGVEPEVRIDRTRLDHFALRPQKRGGLLGTGGGGGGGGGAGERVKARSRIPPEKDRRDRGPPPEQWKC